MVDRLFVQEDEDFNFDRLKLVEPKPSRFLSPHLTIRRRWKPDFREVTCWQPIGFRADRQSSATHRTREDGTTSGEVSRLRRRSFSQTCRVGMGNIGTSECIAPMLRALGDDDDYVRSYAMMGIQRGIDGERCTEVFLDAMFPALRNRAAFDCRIWFISEDGSHSSTRRETYGV